MQTTRNYYFDFLRGFAIIMVVGIHTNTNIHPGFKSIEEICTILIRMALNCAVPIFLAISGYFISKKKIETRKEHLQFLKRQIPSIYIPCLVFSLPYLILSICLDSNSIFTPIAYYLFCGFSVYYFIALIIQYYILLPQLMKLNKSFGIFVCSVISIFSIIIVTYIQRIEGYHPPLIVYAGPFPLWIIFFFMGVYFSSTNRNYSLAAPIIMTMIGFGLQFLEYTFWLGKGQYALGIKLSSFIFSAGIIWLLFSKKIETLYIQNLFTKAVSWIGGISFGIYLLHCYLIIAFDKLLPSYGWIWKWTFVLSSTIIIIWIAKSLFPQFSKKYLGFR